MSQLRDLSRVHDLLLACNLIKTFIGEMNKEEFLTDLKTQSAVIRQIEIIGEASKLISDSFRNQHGSLPWKKMTDMRNILIHMYNEVDVNLVWNVSTIEISKISKYLKTIFD